MGKPEDEILPLLKGEERPLTLIEIARKLGKNPNIVLESLRKLVKNNVISYDPRTRAYNYYYYYSFYEWRSAR
jgi:DNA-binding IclR family transcriptional regulator